MFPGAGASVYYNEAGEVLGWDYPDPDPQPDPDDWYDHDYDEPEFYCFDCGSDEHDEHDCLQHGHNFGAVEHARMTGTPHRKCINCPMVTLDLDE